MTQPKKVLYFAENALSAIQGGGIVAYAVLKGLPADHLLGFYEYRNITPVAEYADRFVYLGHEWRTPSILDSINRLTWGRTSAFNHRHFTDRYVREDLAFVGRHVAKHGFTPEVVYFAGLSYRYLRLAVMAADWYEIPMVQLNMDDWMAIDRMKRDPDARDPWVRRVAVELERSSARSLVSTSNSPRLAAKLSEQTGYRHVAANNCCSDLMACVTETEPQANEIPVITYAGAMNQHLQGETLKVLASAVAELNAEGTRVHLHIYTPWEFAPDANAIEVPNAVFYKGQVGRRDLANIYRRSDFLATTVTYREAHIALFRHSLSTKLSEYLCVGKPVISMGHFDWHLHEYVQDHGCGFSITMDENFSRAAIKERLRRILATDPATRAAIGRSNRALWERAHDVEMMARDTRRAVGLDRSRPPAAVVNGGPRGVVSVRTGDNAAWMPLARLQQICRTLVDVFEHQTVDVIGASVQAFPQLEELVAYCEDIGLWPRIVDTTDAAAAITASAGWEVAGRQWSLAPAQRTPTSRVSKALGLFEQVATLRGTVVKDTPVQRAINQLSVRVPESGAKKSVVWFYGSPVVGREVIAAIEAHPWLSTAVQIGGFLSSPGHCRADMLQGRPWKPVDALSPDAADLIVVTSETSRLAIQEELSLCGLLGRSVPLYGIAGWQPACGYERVPSGPGQAFVKGATARDYALRELQARTSARERPGADTAVRVDRADAA